MWPRRCDTQLAWVPGRHPAAGWIPGRRDRGRARRAAGERSELMVSADLQERKALPWRKRFGSGSGERAEDYIKQGLGLSTLPPGRDNAHLFALSRTLRIRQAFGL